MYAFMCDVERCVCEHKKWYPTISQISRFQILSEREMKKRTKQNSEEEKEKGEKVDRREENVNGEEKERKQEKEEGGEGRGEKGEEHLQYVMWEQGEPSRIVTDFPLGAHISTIQIDIVSFFTFIFAAFPTIRFAMHILLPFIQAKPGQCGDTETFHLTFLILTSNQICAMESPLSTF